MLHQRLIVLDTETTGVLPYDKVVTLAAIRFEGGNYAGHIYRIYDPRRDCHPDAARIHGWDDWLLRFQPLFREEADEVRDWLSWADCLVMHNAAFDLHYVERELRKADRKPLSKPSFCTLESARKRWPGKPCGLATCLDRLGLGSQGERHDAFRDAYLTARLYFRLHDRDPGPWSGAWPAPSNLQPSPPAPPRPWPRRIPKRPGWRDVAIERTTVSDDGRRPEARERRSFKAAIEAARDGQLLIRFVGVRAGLPEETQVRALDAYSAHIAGALNVPLDDHLTSALQIAAFEMIGSQNGATTASKRLVGHPARMGAILPILMDMVKDDARLSNAENAAMRHIFSVMRAAAQAHS